MAIRLSGLSSGLDTESIVKELVSAYNKKTESYTKEQTKLSWKQEAWKGLNTKIYSLYTSVSNLRFSSAYATKKTTSSDTTKATVSAGSDAVNGSHKLNVLSTAQSGYLTGGKMRLAEGASASKLAKDTTLKDLGYDGEATKLQVKTKDAEGQDVVKEIDLKQDSTLTDVIAGLKEAGLNANFDENYGRIYVSSKETGEAADFTISGDADSSTDSVKALSLLGLNTDDSNTYGESAYKIDGKDAHITLNGVDYTSHGNSFSINGLNINVQGVTGPGEQNAITINTATDNQAIYDKVKDFFSQYNEIINEVTKMYNAPSSKGYEPLTDEEKDAMSDTEVEKWETKIKDALLRRDSTLDSVMSSMINAMAKPIELDGKKYSLSNFGISTLGYLNAAENEQNAYHIDGDEDDENTSGKTDKLMDAITKDPDTVVDFMKQLSSNLYSAIDSKMKSTSLSSAYKVYNDKELDSQYKNYTSIIKKWEEKVSDKEDYYYKKFTAMEKAMATLQNQTSSISGLFS